MRSAGVGVGSTFAVSSSGLLLLRLVACAFLLLTSCNEVPPPARTTAPLRFGIFVADASGSREQRAARFRPLVTYLEAHLARPIELAVGNDSGAMLADFEAGTLDVVYQRSISFPLAQQHVGAIPLVTRLEDRRTTSVFLALANDPRQSLQDFRGSRLDFSVRLGSSHVMGRHYLVLQHIDAETFFREVHYSNVADASIDRLRRGQADLSVANSEALLRMLSSGTLRSSDIKIIAETPPHVGQLWFASKALPETLRMNVRDAFLAMSTDDPAQATALKLLGASGYVPATVDDYRQLTDLMRQMQFLEVEASPSR